MGFLIVLAIYLLPGIIASARGHHNTVAIWFLDIFLGWTFLGWIISLVWSFTSPSQQKTVIINQLMTIPQPVHLQQQPTHAPPAPAPVQQVVLPPTELNGVKSWYKPDNYPQSNERPHIDLKGFQIDKM